MKTKLLFLSIFFSIASLAQETPNSLKLNSLLNANKTITLPTNAGFFTKHLGFQPRPLDCSSCEQGFYFQWSQSSDFFLNFAQMNDGSESITINNFTKTIVAGLPLGLQFNQSNAEECFYKFKKYKAVRYQESYEVSDTENSAFMVVEFSIDTIYYKLSFVNDDLLTGIVISTKPIE
ncbi:hypothetical protein HNP99_001735 [Flavobacterium sp. 28A]|uniref:hypothetical protein n=1 Tax=Flavobacterium sp. 28A TaxID=2735895 RepID=UPI00156EBD1F|nr:hypothetical protein [Flavobacterium sp. 28A]NRT15388.1 hypothetical protein [Flavobacterium sp. 28A]